MKIIFFPTDEKRQLTAVLRNAGIEVQKVITLLGSLRYF
jgi:hypothetical protein